MSRKNPRVDRFGNPEGQPEIVLFEQAAAGWVPFESVAWHEKWKATAPVARKAFLDAWPDCPKWPIPSEWYLAGAKFLRTLADFLEWSEGGSPNPGGRLADSDAAHRNALIRYLRCEPAWSWLAGKPEHDPWTWAQLDSLAGARDWPGSYRKLYRPWLRDELARERHDDDPYYCGADARRLLFVLDPRMPMNLSRKPSPPAIDSNPTVT